ncbi:MAG: toll/interleukin-1 receptor domain-containing protein [Candidatus Aminicenantes bacterium]|nr:toll/interleukin-1 receptor domain-containing protein [Candidatus Aminicenantes bacterium]
MRHEDINFDNCNNFDWDELLQKITRKELIPVIGHGLYSIEKDGEKISLYDYIAERLANEIGFQITPDVNHKFFTVALEYLKNSGTEHDYNGLKRIIRSIIDSEESINLGPLRKLARIKSFNVFINTSNDDFLLQAIKSVRAYKTIVHDYSIHTKDLYKLDNDLFESLRMFECTFLFNLYGSLKEHTQPALTESDILETLFEFQKDVEANPGNNFFSELKNKSFLFIGCGYDDWLFRFFIRTISNEPYENPKNPRTGKYIGDDFRTLNKKLFYFLKHYEVEIYYSSKGEKFVDVLFEKLSRRETEQIKEIIPFSDFPQVAFISYSRKDRAAAVTLASNLKEDGITVWLDKSDVAPGDMINKTIIQAMGNCPVFIPLISKNSKELTHEDDIRYHYREWTWVHDYNEQYENNPKIVIPVTIDDIEWFHDYFKNISHARIKGGERCGDYESLKERLAKLQENWK